MKVPRGQGQDTYDITVEGALYGAGVPWEDIPRLAGRFRDITREPPSLESYRWQGLDT